MFLINWKALMLSLAMSTFVLIWVLVVHHQVFANCILALGYDIRCFEYEEWYFMFLRLSGLAHLIFLMVVVIFILSERV